MNVGNIVEGWFNVARQKLGIADENVEALAKIRGEICIACDRIGKENYKCAECGCPIEAKIRAPHENCPIQKW